MDVLFVQGGGAGAYDEDAELVASLQNALGSSCTVHYPKMPEENAPDYAAWKAKILEELSALEGGVVLAGHSVGASVLLMVVAEERPDVAGLFLLAPPYWGETGWEVGGLASPETFTSGLPPHLPIFLYGSRDDDVVPSSHTGRYAAALPGATVRMFDKGGHQFGNDLAGVARDMRMLGTKG